jgi:hypothetical protein
MRSGSVPLVVYASQGVPGEFAVDVDGMGAVEVDALVVGGPDVGQDRVLDGPAARRSAATAKPRYPVVQVTMVLAAR